MSFRTLLTVLTDPACASPAMGQAIALAETQNAHTEALCLGVDRSQAGYYFAGASGLVLHEALEAASAEAQATLAAARDMLRASGVRWSATDGVAQLADLNRHVAYRARFADLTVLPKPYGPNRPAEAEAIVEAALFEGQSPVLVVPDTRPAIRSPSQIILAWNESPEALRAIRAAIPFLAAAECARIVVIDPPSHGPDRSDPGGVLAQMLARHGVRCEIDVLGKTMPRVSDILCRHVSDCAADMVVMGAYGHSRFREAILGGATRNMLEQAQVPVFLAH